MDTVFGKGNENEELRAILNAGFERGSKVRRCVGPNHDLKDFAVFCPKALAGIGRLPDTVSDRCIPIHLIAKKKSDKIQRFRKREVNVEGLAAALEAYSQKPEISINARLELGSDVKTWLVFGRYLVITRCFPVFAMSRNELNATLVVEDRSTVALENAAEGCSFSQSFKLVSPTARSNSASLIASGA